MEGAGAADEPSNKRQKTVLSCPHCTQEFSEVKRQREHIQRKHGPASDRTCSYCLKELSNRGSLTRHLKTCPKKPSNAVECRVTPITIPVDENNPHRKVNE
jgi:hypothetical protein